MIHVMIIEDDFRIADIHAEIVSKLAGFTVIDKVLNTRDALEVIRRERVDLLLIDIYLPDKSGIELLWELRKNKQYIDAIVITAAMEREMMHPLLRLGVFDLVFKPAEVSRLINALEKYRTFFEQLSRDEIVNQAFIDHFFYKKELQAKKDRDMPKGIDRLTLERIQSVMGEYREGLTAEEVAGLTGTSRTTARRYLEYLISTRDVEAEQEYGIVGRPLRKYRKR